MKEVRGGGESIKRAKQLIVPHFPIPRIWGSGVQLKNQANGHASYTAVNSLKFGYYMYMYMCTVHCVHVNFNIYTNLAMHAIYIRTCTRTIAEHVQTICMHVMRSVKCLTRG